MGLNNFGLGIILSGEDKGATRALKETESGFRSMGNAGKSASTDLGAALGQVSTALAAFAAAAGPVLGLKSFADAAGDFEFQLRRVAGSGGQSAKAMVEYRKAAIAAGIATQYNPTEVLESMRQLRNVGLDQTEVVKMLVPSLDLAAAKGISVSDAAQTAAATMKIYGISLDKVSAATDKLGQSGTGLRGEDLMIAISHSAKGAITAEQSLTEMVTAMGLARKSGLEISIVSSSINRALVSMATTGKKQFEQLGIKVGDANDNFRPFLDILMELDDKTKDMGAVKRTQIWGEALGHFGTTSSLAIKKQLSDGIRDAEGNILKGGAAVEYLRKKLEGGEGSLARYRDRLLDTFKGQQLLLSGSLATLKVLIGEPIAKVLKPAIQMVVDTVNRIIAIWERMNPVHKEVIAKVLVLATSFTTVVFALAALKMLLPLIVPLIGSFGASLLTIGLALIPIALVAGAIFALKVAWDKNIGGFRDTTQEAVDKLMEFSAKFKDGFLAGLNDQLARLDEPIHTLVSSLNDLFDILDLDELKMTETASGWEKGATAGRALGAAILALIEVFAGLIDMYGWAIEAFDTYLRYMEWNGQWIGSFLGEILSYFIRFGMFLGETAGEIANLLVYVFDVMGRAIMAVFDGILDKMIVVARLMPSTFQTGPFSHLAGLKTSEESGATKERGGDAYWRTLKLPERMNVRTGVSRGVNDVPAGSPVPLFDSLKALLQGKAFSPQNPERLAPVKVQLFVDGKKMAEQVVAHQKDAEASAFEGE